MPDLIEDLKIALEKGQFLLHYQTQVNHLRTVRGFEALIRWNHPRRGLLYPAQFMDDVERQPVLMNGVGYWVLKESLGQLRSWAKDPLKSDWILGINVSAVQLAAPLFSDQVIHLLREFGVRPSRVRLELTETIALTNLDLVIDHFHKLRAVGVSISLDDFGTGYSSLSYLNDLPINEIKVAGTLLSRLDSAPKNSIIILKSVLALGTELGLEVLIEGVETESQFEQLCQMGYPFFQGHLFGYQDGGGHCLSCT